MKTFFITTSIPYANASPHVGTILDPLYADVLARYKRQHGFDTLFLTGTDEHGLKIARSALMLKKTPQAFVDDLSLTFRGLKGLLNLSSDDFIRTSDKVRHWPGAEKIWRLLLEKGDLYEKEYEGLYCIGHEAFITEKELVDGKCPDHQKAPESVKEKNWFFRLSKYSKEIQALVENDTLRVLPLSRKNEILSLLKAGLEDVSFSRPSKDLNWGIPVPNDSTQTMYVWCDALANYVSALGYASSDDSKFKKFWPADIHMVGKDNLRFHAAIWPGMLLSAGIPLPKAVYVHGFVNVDGKKISKSLGNVIDPYELVKKYGTDPVRYYLLREFSPAEDGDFTYAKFEERYNNDLASGLGNLVSRVCTLGEKASFKSLSPKSSIEGGIVKEIERVRALVQEKVEQFRFHEALAAIWELISFTDKYLNTNEPWKKTGDEAARPLLNAVAVIDVIAALIAPFLPGTAEEITRRIVWNEKTVLEIKTGKALFPRLH